MKVLTHACTRQQRLVSTRPSRRDNNGINDVRDRRNPSLTCRDDEGRLRSCTRLVIKARVIARNEHANHNNSQDIEERNPSKHALTGARDDLARTAGLRSSHSDGLGAGEGEDGGAHDGPVAQEAAPGTRADVLDEGAGLDPVGEAAARDAGDAAEADDEAEDDEEHDEEDLEQGEPELDLAVDADEGDAHAEGQQDRQADPQRRVEVRPELEEHAERRDLGRDREPVSVDL